MKCIYCFSFSELPGGELICDNCYEKRQADILRAFCPYCLSGDVTYQATANLWLCHNCGEPFEWDWS